MDANETPSWAQPLRALADKRAMLDFERLDAYQCTVQFVQLSLKAAKEVARSHPDLSEQLRRATHSIPLNIAEGSGKTTHRDRARFNAIARGSDMECAAIFQLLALHEAIPKERANEARALLVRIVSMLSRMAR